MEGSPHLKLNPYESTKKEQTILVVIIILFHLVGLIGFCIPSLQPLFIKLVPWHILLMLVVIVVSHRPLDSKFILFALLIFIIGFCAEWVGVHKNWIFGNYNYGQTLGLKLSKVPLTIGINWFLLIYATGILFQRSRIRGLLIRMLLGAILLVLLDLLIEPVAMHFDYWHWSGDKIPYQNYIGWFLVSVMMLFVFEKFNFKKQSIVAPVLLLMQFVFFVVLRLL